MLTEPTGTILTTDEKAWLRGSLLGLSKGGTPLGSLCLGVFSNTGHLPEASVQCEHLGQAKMCARPRDSKWSRRRQWKEIVVAEL